MIPLIWHTEQRVVRELIPYEKNPRKITEEQKQRLKESLQRFNLTEIPGIDIDDKLIWGFQRVRILIAIGRGDEQIDVRIPNRKLTEEEFRELNIRSNLHAGEWDFERLIQDFSEEQLSNWGLDTGGIEFPEEDAPEESSPIPKVSEKPPVIKTGDVFYLGHHMVICGDSTDPKTFATNMGADKVSLVFTSPPYNMNANWGMYKGYKDDMASEEYIGFNMKVIENILPYLSGFMFWNISYNRNSRWEFLEIAHRIMLHPMLKFLELVIWDKKSAYPVTSNTMLTRQYEPIFVAATEEMADLDVFYVAGNRQCYFNKVTGKSLTNYWQVPTQMGTHQKNHKACYPVELVRKGIEAMSQLGDTVLDPFLGAGSTLIAAEQTGRTCIGVEQSPEYCELIIARYCNYMQQQNKIVRFTHINGTIELQQIINNSE
jgi:DNA modification methylase